MNRIWFAKLVLLLLLASKAGAVEEPLPLGVSFVSPNGRYSVHLEEIDGEPHFVITEKGIGRVDDSIAMPTRLLYLRWADDSRSFVTVEHIAKGSYGRVIYHKDKKWINLEVNPPYDGRMNASIVGLELKPDHVHYKFAVRTLTTSWLPMEDRICDFDLSLTTREISNIKWTPISDFESLKNLMLNPVYRPPMDYKGPRER